MRPTTAPPSNVFETVDAANGVDTDYLVGIGNSFYGSLEKGDSDWIAVELFAGAVYNFQLIGTGLDALPDDRAHISLFTYNGGFVTKDDALGDDQDGIAADIWFRAEYTGTYYLKASSKGIGDYEVTTSYSATGLPNFKLTADAVRAAETDKIAKQLTNGYWEDKGEETRHFDIPARGALEVNITALTVEGQFLATKALSAWSAFTGIAFNFVTVDGDITFDDNEDGAFASSSLDPVKVGITAQAHVNVSTAWLEEWGTTTDSYGFQTYLHEVGHALGLGHAGNYNGTATFGVDNLFDSDSWQATVMSYFSQNTNTNIDADYAYILTPMAADILAIQQIYGTTGTLRTGDTVYGDNATAGDFYDVLSTLKNPVAFTILDDGGRDTIDMSSVQYRQNINLKSGSISDTMGLQGNMTIDRNTVIENAIGGVKKDVITGNAIKNILQGGDGGDDLRGLGGSDRLRGDNGADKLNGGKGRDFLTGGAGKDTFVFNSKSGKDTLQDFENDVDSIQLSTKLWEGTLTAQQVVNRFASVVDGNTLLDFGDVELKIKGLTDVSVLVDDLVIV